MTLSYEQILEKIQENSDATKEEIEAKVKEKLDQLSGLISKEGAAHIIANELNVKLLEQFSKRQKIQDLTPDSKGVELLAKVLQVYDIRSFKVQDREGKVGRLFVGDDTGKMQIVCWGESTDAFEKIKPGACIVINNAYAKQNNNFTELHINKLTDINPNPDETVEVNETAQRKEIKELQAGQSQIELLATIVDINDPRFYEVCAECNKRVRADTDFKCDEHTETPHSYAYLMNITLDDGTGNIRSVLFRNLVEKALSKPKEDMLKLREDISAFAPIKEGMLGNIVKVQGRVNRNEMMDSNEFVIQDIDMHPDPKAELQEKSE